MMHDYVKIVELTNSIQRIVNVIACTNEQSHFVFVIIEILFLYHISFNLGSVHGICKTNLGWKLDFEKT